MVNATEAAAEAEKAVGAIGAYVCKHDSSTYEIAFPPGGGTSIAAVFRLTITRTTRRSPTPLNTRSGMPSTSGSSRL